MDHAVQPQTTPTTAEAMATGATAESEGNVSKQKPLRNAMQAIVEAMNSGRDAEVAATALDRTHVVNNLLLLLEAAHGTTFFATTALVAELIKQPESLRTLQAEAAEVDSLTLETASVQLPYTEACIKETLRLYPFAGSVPKKLPAGERFEVGGRVVEGPCDVWLSFSHHFVDPKVFPEPLRFEPRRWLGERAPEEWRASEHAIKCFTPFGMGVHVCLGQKLAMLTMKCAVWSFARSGVVLEPTGPLERVPDILPEFVVKGGVEVIVRRHPTGEVKHAK